MLNSKDLVKRKKFATKAAKLLRGRFWTDKGICNYFDGVSFAHKYNPLDEAKTCGTMAWRKPNEGLSVTAKGKKEGSGGRTAKFFVAISYSKGVVLCEQYVDRLNGPMFNRFVRNNFPTAFERSSNPTNMLFLQDGDPSRKSAKAKEA